jgi:hypothetical protein
MARYSWMQILGIAMKYATDRPYADPEAAARRILEIAKQVELAMKGRIYIELINGPFLFRDRGSPAEYGAGLRLLVERKLLEIHESGTYVSLLEDHLLSEVRDAPPTSAP